MHVFNMHLLSGSKIIKKNQLDVNSTQTSKDSYWMQHAYKLSLVAQAQQEVPVGAVLIKDEQIVGEGWNRPITQHDPSAHAEIIALREAAQNLQNYRLIDTTLYVTLEPCVMCAGAIITARVKRVVFAAFDHKSGAAGSVFSVLGTNLLNHIVDVETGPMAEECSILLKDFFKSKRGK